MSLQDIKYAKSPEMALYREAYSDLVGISSVWWNRRGKIAKLWSKESYDKRSLRSWIDLFIRVQPIHESIEKLATKIEHDVTSLIRIGLKPNEWYANRTFDPNRIVLEMNLLIKTMKTIILTKLAEHKRLIDAVYSLPVHYATQEDLSEFCPSCIEDFEEGDLLVVFPCKHKAHYNCISDTILTVPFCPADRISVIKRVRFA